MAIESKGFIVTEKAMRPASNSKECFYCRKPIGSHHKDDCVLILKKARIKMTIELDVEVPANWSRDQVEFKYNGSSWCADNILDDLERISESQGCLCASSEFEYLGENPESFLRERDADLLNAGRKE